MCDQEKIERELSGIVCEIGGLRDCGAWAQIITRNMQHTGATRVPDLTVAQLLQAITDAEQAMAEQSDPRRGEINLNRS